MSMQPPADFFPLSLPASGFLGAIGPFHGRREGDRLTIGLPIEPRHCSSSGAAHGGMLLSLVDVVLTVCANFNADLSRFLPTVNLGCDFLQKVPQGGWIQGSAEVLRVARQHVFAQTTLVDASGRACVRASGVLLLRGEADPAYARSAYLSNFPGNPP